MISLNVFRSLQVPVFDDHLESHGHSPLRAQGTRTLQVNVGRRCNQTCSHCHIDAGPHRTEEMDLETVDLVLDVLKRHEFDTLDITGGAPELNPHFRHMVDGARDSGVGVIDRCNLTILIEPGFEDLVEFLASRSVRIVASLPCYEMDNVDEQRGKGVFEKSIAALHRLNAAGFGVGGSGLVLDLIFNPLGAKLAPPQSMLEGEYKHFLLDRYGIRFNTLLAMNNVPINRFARFLERSGELGVYMDDLVAAFNSSTIDGLMCRHQVSVRWDGCLFDCDFNLISDVSMTPGQPRHIRDFDQYLLSSRRIATAAHCFACTAGKGSSCGGSVAVEEQADA